MKLRYFNVLGLIFFILLNGCATTGTNQNSNKDADSLVSDAVPQEVKVTEFILGAGDKIEIIVYRNDDLRRTIQIDTSGKITYPLVGDIQAGGLSIFQLQERIRDGLSRYIKNPEVSVGITAVQSQKVIVLGEVKNPGFFQLDTPLTALEAISIAGGFTLDGNQESVLFIRQGAKKPEVRALNLEKSLKEGDLTQNIALAQGDIIYVPRTFIANVDRFFEHFAKIVSPILGTETGVWIGQNIEAGPRRNKGVSVLP